MTNNNFALETPALNGEIVQQGHADYCAENGHQKHTINGELQPMCPRCGYYDIESMRSESVEPATVSASEYAKGIVTVADIACEPYSIERVEDTVYVEIDRKTNAEIAWGYCIDGIGIYWFDSMEELNEEYDVYDLVEYIDGQLQG